nr:AAA family ATPase [Alkaliphilus hydrothermalis]
MDAFVEEEIHSGFSETNNQTVGKSEGCKIFSIYSPMGGVGKTTVAVATGTLLAQMGKKVLYLNLEGISSQYIYFQQGSEYSLSNIFYLTKNRNKNLTLKLESMVMKDYATQIHYIAPLDSPLELEEIEPKDIEYLLTELEGSRMYDYIILDLSSNFDSNNLKFMTMSHKVMMILNHDPIARTKGDQLLEQINRTPQVKDKLLDKIIWIMNCSMVDDGDDLVEEIQIDVEEKFIKFNLPESRESWVKRDGKLVLNSSSPLAKAVLDMLNTLEI